MGAGQYLYPSASLQQEPWVSGEQDESCAEHWLPEQVRVVPSSQDAVHTLSAANEKTGAPVVNTGDAQVSGEAIAISSDSPAAMASMGIISSAQTSTKNLFIA